MAEIQKTEAELAAEKKARIEQAKEIQRVVHMTQHGIALINEIDKRFSELKGVIFYLAQSPVVFSHAELAREAKMARSWMAKLMTRAKWNAIARFKRNLPEGAKTMYDSEVKPPNEEEDTDGDIPEEDEVQE